MNIFHFRGNNRHIIILPKSAPAPAGFALAGCEIQGAAGQLVREISPHLAQNVNALSHACSLLQQVGVSVPALARTVAPKLSDCLASGLLRLYTEIEKVLPYGENENSGGQGDAAPGVARQEKTLPPSRGQLDDNSPLAGTSSNNTALDVPIAEQECRSDPVSMLSGEEILPLVDFELSAAMPFSWRRLYRSGQCDSNLGLGYGWRHHFCLQLVEKYQPPPKVGPAQPGKHWLELTDEEGRVHVFDAVKRGQTSVQLASGWSLYYQQDGKQVLIKPDDSHWTFVKATSKAVSEQEKGQVEDVWLLESISNYLGQYFSLHYDKNHRLVRIACSARRGIVLQYNHDHNLLRIAAYVCDDQGEQQLLPGFLASYQYDDNQALIAATNSRGEVERYAYFDDYLLKRRTRASGFSHHFLWQRQALSKAPGSGQKPEQNAEPGPGQKIGQQAQAKCIKQWGDDDTYCYRFDYQDCEDGQLTTSTDSLGNVEQFVHNRQGLLIAHTDPRGFTRKTDYDSVGRKIRQTDAGGEHTLYRYNEQGQLAEVIGADGGRSRYFYNALGKRILTLDPLGQQYQRKFDGTGRLLSQTGPDGRSIRYHYTELGQLKQKVAADGVKSLYHWDASGELLALQVGDKLTRYSYDRLGRLNASIDAQGLITEFVRDEKGQVVEQLSYDRAQPDNKIRKSFCYDDAGRLISEQAPDEAAELSAAQSSAVDAEAEPGADQPPGNETRYHYQGLAQPSQKTFADGSYLKYSYDNERNLTAITRSDGQRYQIDYSESEQPVKLVGFDGREQHYGYDDNDKLISVSDSGERFIRLKRDNMGRIVEQSSVVANSGKPQKEHNKADDKAAGKQATELTNKPGNKTGISFQHNNFYQYDLLGRLTRAHNSQRTVQLSYHRRGAGSGQFKQVQQGNWSLDYDYNSKGQRASVKLPDGSCLLYEYDQNGQLSQLDYLNKSQAGSAGNKLKQAQRAGHTLGQSRPLMQCQYNKAGLMTGQTLGNGLLLSQSFDVHSRLTEQHWRSATAADEHRQGQVLTLEQPGFNEQRFYQYDQQHQLLSCRQVVSGVATSPQAGVTTFNAGPYQNNRQVQTAGGKTQGHEKVFRYNRLSQLINAREGEQDGHYHWDAFGNPVAACGADSKKTSSHPGEPAQAQQVGNDEVALSSAGQVKVHQDRLVSFNGTDYGYDSCGNQISSLTKGEQQQRFFDGLNQLRQLNVNGALTHYEYDALGRRSAKITEQGRTDFIWDNHQLIGEHCQGKFTWYIYYPGSFLPVALVKNGEVYYYHLDQLGTPLCLTDKEAKAVWRNNSDVFGAPLGEQGGEPLNEIENPLRFQGQYFDRESGLHYNRFRYYCPRQGRFIHQDPIGLAGGINPYQYAPNPVNWVDPFGLECKEDKLSNDKFSADPYENLNIENGVIIDAAQESASYQGQDPYFGVDKLENIELKKDAVLAHITWKPQGGITGKYFTTLEAVESARAKDGVVSSRALNQGLQVYAGDDRLEYKKQVQLFTVNEDIPFGGVAYGSTTKNPQFNPGRYKTHPQYYVKDEHIGKLQEVPGSLEVMKDTDAPDINEKLMKIRKKNETKNK
ncbi:RHS repeat-associated core domain-containing protein [Thalassomonas haliotis]|uniref:RHS domain-containing protein n=1 Tax=Thalassomonas haliotis TaxID=485448 RepID=A0ABY7VKE6_9GAMM|nr:RHS repeat-associated core domain-containing protein [Thalassomonas haliotis]WDE13511.1 RHS domain-containing protein [Thalassomonas haliotis]